MDIDTPHTHKHIHARRHTHTYTYIHIDTYICLGFSITPLRFTTTTISL